MILSPADNSRRDVESSRTLRNFLRCRYCISFKSRFLDIRGHCEKFVVLFMMFYEYLEPSFNAH